MLPQRLRLHRSSDFVSVLRKGHKVSRPTLILYSRPSEQPRFGLIVGKTVGGAVQRNLVKRRLRHWAHALLSESSPMDVVVRALPASLTEDTQMARDIATAWVQAEQAVRSK